MIIGIDVGGSAKGFHLAQLESGASEIQDLAHGATVAEVVVRLKSVARILIVAIDCPPRAQLTGALTRAAERELHRRGFRVQWTRRQSHEPAEWMHNGERLWRALAEEFPKVAIIETFPTVAVTSLATSAVTMPLHLLSQHADRRDWKDFVDACICCEVGSRYLRGDANAVGVSEGDPDELGPIWY